MTTIVPRRAGFVCQACHRAQATRPSAPRVRSLLERPTKRRNISSSVRPQECSKSQMRYASTALPAATTVPSSKRAKPRSKAPAEPHRSSTPIDDLHPIDALSTLKAETSRLISSTTVPEEPEVLELLNRFHEYSNVLVFGKPTSPVEDGEKYEVQNTENDTLSDLEETVEETTVEKPKELSLTFRQKAADTTCDLLYKLVKDPKIFISPTVLQVYTRVICLLGKPEYLPHIFHLYAHKPIAVPKTNPIKYKKQWPNVPKNAIPRELSDAALDAAILKKDMPLAITIIDTTVGTQAYRTDKIIRRASLPFAVWLGAPTACFAGAKWVSETQNVWDPEMAQWTTIAAGAAYVGTLTTLGLIALTTWNDHFDRIHWREGTAGHHRWTHEDERAYFDRIAVAWGFQEKMKRGEEQGEEWEALREVVGLRGMILDKTQFLEGMQ